MPLYARCHRRAVLASGSAVTGAPRSQARLGCLAGAHCPDAMHERIVREFSEVLGREAAGAIEVAADGQMNHLGLLVLSA